MLINGETPTISTYPFNSTSLMVLTGLSSNIEITRYVALDTEVEYTTTSGETVTGIVKSYNSIYDILNNTIIEVPIGSSIRIIETNFVGTTVEIEVGSENNIDILYDATDIQRHAGITNIDGFCTISETDIVVNEDNTITLTPQSGIIDGLAFWFNENINLDIESGSTSPRIDLVVLQKDQSQSTLQVAIKKGTPSSEPVTPSIENTPLGFYELPIFSIYIDSLQTVFSSDDITDLREENIKLKVEKLNQFISIASNSIEVGETASATGICSTAIGFTNYSTGEGSVSIGRFTKASEQSSISIGYASQATGKHTNAIGYAANASALSSNAIGDMSIASGSNSNAIGVNATSSGIRANAIGNLAYATYDDSTAIGSWATTAGTSRITLGKSGITTYVYAFSNISDGRDKDDINDLAIGLDFVNKLKSREYRWNARDNYILDLKDEHQKKVQELKEKHLTDINAIEINNSISQISEDNKNKKIKTIQEEQAAEIDELEKQFTCKLADVKRGTKHKGSRLWSGFIAQEVKEALDETGVDYAFFKDGKLDGGEDQMSLDYTQFVPILVNAVQELSNLVQILTNKVAELETK